MYRMLFLLLISTQALSQTNTLFNELSPEKSGIDFFNKVVDNENANSLIYENFYSGSGVAIGDINNDGLLDVYFGGNQVGDELYLNQGNLQFKKITKEAGIKNLGGWTTGVTIVDINGDGLQDIYVCKSLYDDSPEIRTNELYINNGDLTFTESAAQVGLNDFWRTQHAIFLDYDRDNDLDVFLVNQPPNPGPISALRGLDWRDKVLGCKLMQNNDGYFTEITELAGLSDAGYALSATATDFNKDGWVDLYVSHDYNNPDYLFINQQDGTFKNTIDESMAHISYFSMGVDAADVNNDGLDDIVVVDMVPEDNYRLKANMGGMYPAAFWKTVADGGHYQYMLNTLQLNRGVDASETVIFSDIAQYADVAYTDWSWSPLIADFNNDGFKDMLVTNGLVRDLRNTDAIKKMNEYLAPHQDLLAKRRENPASVDLWAHLSLEKLLSFFPSEKINNYIFQNKDGLGFEKKQKEWGLGEPTFSTGAAYGDLDNDGDLDLLISHQNRAASVYENTTNNSDVSFIRVALSSESTTLLGSSATLKFKDGSIQHSNLTSARGFYSSSEPVLHFGFDSQKKPEGITITWVNGETSVLRKPSVNQLTKVVYEETQKTDVSDETATSYLVEVRLQDEFRHKENDFDDFEREVLLPHKMSQTGPSIAISRDQQSFYLPGAKGSKGSFHKILEDLSVNSTYLGTKDSEEVAATFFDADGDGDEDLYVATGGNEFDNGSEYQADKLFLNIGGEFKESSQLLPTEYQSNSVVIPNDFDKDGDIDLFIGGNQIPGRYPEKAASFIYRNELMESGKAKFTNITSEIAPELLNLGMVTDAVWTDVDMDEDADLVITGEWMPVTIFTNESGAFNNSTASYGLSNTVGWWNSVDMADLDKDGDEDLVLGNLGLNYKFKASEEEPFIVYYDDFDENGKFDIVLGYYNFGELYPVRGRSCSSAQVPEIKKKFGNYDAFASANIFQVYGESSLQQALKYEATIFESAVLKNNQGSFELIKLPEIAQLAPINSTSFMDVDGDGNLDIIYAGNKYGSEVETPRADAGIGGVLLNQGDFNFKTVTPNRSGLFLNTNVKDLQMMKIGGIDHLVVVSNDEVVRFFRLRK